MNITVLIVVLGFSLVLSGCHSVSNISVVEKIPIIMTMGSYSTNEGVCIVWEWRVSPENNQTFTLIAEAKGHDGSIVASSCELICGSSFFISCEPSLVKEVRVVAREVTGKWESCGGFLFLGESR